MASSATTAETTPTGTAGTPAVKTRSEIDVRRLEVTSIKPTGNRCGDK